MYLNSIAGEFKQRKAFPFHKKFNTALLVDNYGSLLCGDAFITFVSKKLLALISCFIGKEKMMQCM